MTIILRNVIISILSSLSVGWEIPIVGQIISGAISGIISYSPLEALFTSLISNALTVLPIHVILYLLNLSLIFSIVQQPLLLMLVIVGIPVSGFIAYLISRKVIFKEDYKVDSGFMIVKVRVRRQVNLDELFNYVVQELVKEIPLPTVLKEKFAGNEMDCSKPKVSILHDDKGNPNRIVYKRNCGGTFLEMILYQEGKNRFIEFKVPIS